MQSPPDIENRRDFKPLSRVDIAVFVLIAAYAALYMWQVNILPTERYPNWDAYWVDVRTMAGLASLRDALLHGELPLINPFDGLAANLGGNHHSPIGILNFLVLLLDPVRTMIVAQYVVLVAGASYSYAYLRIFSKNVPLCLLGALMYIGMPIITSRYYFDQTLFGFVLIPVFLFHTHKLVAVTTELSRASHATTLAIYGAAVIGMGDIFVLITLPSTVFIYTIVLVRGLMHKSWLVSASLALGASLLPLLSGSYYTALLLENLVQNARDAAVFVANGLLPAATTHVPHFFEYMFWSFAAGSLVLPMHGSGAFLYAPIAFYLILAGGFYALVRHRQSRTFRAVSASGLLAAGLFPFLFMWFFYSDTLYALLPAISTAATGRIRHLWNLWPFLVTLATFVVVTGRESGEQKIPNWIVAAGVVALAVEYWLFFFVPSENSLYNISHVDTTGFSSPNRIAISFLGDPWFLLPLVNLTIVLLIGAALTPKLRHLTSSFSAAWGLVAGVIIASLAFAVVQNELRVYQGDWQLATSNDIRYRSYLQRRACIDRAVDRADPNYRTMVASAPVFGPFGRNWKLIAETELSSADRVRTLYSWREIVDPYVPMTLGLFTGTFSRVVEFPPTTDQLVAHADLLGLLGVRWVISADQPISNAAFMPITACTSPDGPMARFWHEKEGGTLYVYAIRDSLPIAWIADKVEVENKSAIVHRIFVDRDKPWLTKTALVDHLPADFAATAGGDDGSTAVVQSTTNLTLTISAKSAGNRVLVIDYVRRPGWSATVDGKSVPVLNAFGGMMAVALPAGTHEVKLTYRSPTLFWGVLLSVLTVLTPFAAYGIASMRRIARRSALC